MRWMFNFNNYWLGSHCQNIMYVGQHKELDVSEHLTVCDLYHNSKG